MYACVCVCVKVCVCVCVCPRLANILDEPFFYARRTKGVDCAEAASKRRFETTSLACLKGAKRFLGQQTLSCQVSLKLLFILSVGPSPILGSRRIGDCPCETHVRLHSLRMASSVETRGRIGRR